MQLHCRHSTAGECITVVNKMSADQLAQFLPPGVVYVHDARVRAIVVAAPALGFTFGREELKDIHAPVQLWRDEFDHVLPSSRLRGGGAGRPADAARVPSSRQRRPF